MPINQKKKKKREGNLSLRHPTWLSLLDWAVKTVVPCPQDYQEEILHTLIGFREARDEPDN